MRWHRFVHRPVRVKAVRFDEEHPPDFVRRDPRAVGFMMYMFENKYGETLYLDHGDWIVEYPDGERIPMTDKFFARRFDRLP